MIKLQGTAIGERVFAAAFWLLAASLIGLRLVLASDLSVQLSYEPHDDSLYVERALHLLAGNAFGPYDSYILVKYPGLSLWLAGMRRLGVPFLVSINGLYVAAGLYLLYAFLRAGLSRWLVLVAFALYLLNPITFSYEWIRVIREPLATGLLVLIVAAMAHIFAAIEQNRTPWVHLAVFAPVFAFSLFVREDDRLLWGLLALFGAALIWQSTRKFASLRPMAAFIASAILLPAVVAKTYEYSLRTFVEQHYGLPIIHTLGEGEYPRLLSAIRAIETQKDNRMVMVTQQALQELRIEVPIFAPVIDRLPPPGPGTFSCRLHGVCSEWSNGWMPFWIKDEAFRAGLAPTLAQEQDYFRRVREAIERACETRQLRCTRRGEGLVAPMELRWTRAYVEEAWRLVKMTLWPQSNAVGVAPLIYDVPVELGRKFQAVTMTDFFDTQRQTRFVERPNVRPYENPIASWRKQISDPFRLVAAILLALGIVAMSLRLWFFDRVPPSALVLVALVFGAYSLLRLAALSYIAVYMGTFDSRMVFSTNVLGTVLALVLLADSARAAAAGRDKGKKNA